MKRHKENISKSLFQQPRALGFNLKSSDRGIDFDDDEVSVGEIKHSELKCRLKKLVGKMLDKTITVGELIFFKTHIKEFHDDPFYVVKDLDTLDVIIQWCCKNLGPACDLNWIDVRVLKDLSFLFFSNKAVNSFCGDISKWDVSGVTDMRYTFCDSNFNGDISKWDVSNVEHMNMMFENSQFNGDISEWDVSNVKNMTMMFAASEFKNDISNWDISEDTKTTGMFDGAECPEKYKPKRLLRTQKVEESVSNFNLRKDSNTDDIDFDNDEVTASDIENGKLKFMIEVVKAMIMHKAEQWEIDKFKARLKYFKEPFWEPYDSKELLSLIETSIEYLGNDCDLNWIDVSKIDDMTIYVEYRDDDPETIGMFEEYPDFNGDISKWDVSHVIYMSLMFKNNKAFNGDISKWDVSNVEDMEGMFYNSEFNSDISQWDVSNVISMSDMFYKSNFNGDISQWDVSNVTSMSNMFQHAVFNGDISQWDVSHVKNMLWMFQGSYFNGDISEWNINKSCHTENAFTGCRISKEHKPKVLQNISESVSNFNLRRDNGANSVDFDDDEVTASDIKGNRLSFMLEMVNEMKTALHIEEWKIEKFNARLKYFNEPFYKAKDSEDIRQILSWCLYQKVTMDLNWIDTSGVTSLEKLFSNVTLNHDISRWDVSNVTNMKDTFADSQFNGDISNWNVSNVTNMHGTFYNSKFNRDISRWDVSNVEAMDTMFRTSKFNGDISNWNVSKCKNMESMFAISDFSGDLSEWDVSNVENMSHMFYMNVNFNSDISKWNVSKVKNMQGMFLRTYFNKDISSWDICSDCYTVDMYASSEIDLKNKAFPKIEESISNFNLRRNTREIDFDDDEIKPEQMQLSQTKHRLLQIVGKLKNDNEVNELDITYFKKHCIEFENEPFYMVHTNNELQYLITACTYHLGSKCNLNWIDTHLISDMSNVFSSSKFNGDISKWNVSHVTNMRRMFLNSKFNGDISKWDVSNVEGACYMFYNTEFNGDISNWDVSNLQNMYYMFSCSKFNGDISKWNVSNVEDMSHAFELSDFNGDISKWDVHNVKYMTNMFANSKFDNDISKWDVSNVINTSGMFYNSVFNKDISKWDVSNVINMGNMFMRSKFNSDISGWTMYANCLTNAMFFECSIKEEYKPKALQKLSESVSNFNLKGDRPSAIQFNGDEVTASDIHQNKADSMLEIVKAILDSTVTEEQVNIFNRYVRTFTKPFYKVKNKSKLEDLISKCIAYLGKECDLNWIDVSKIKDMTYLFQYFDFNGDISRWDVSNVKNMAGMFAHSKFNGDISLWDVSHVENMYAVFEYSHFNQDISKWDVSGCQYMGSMFSGSKFNNDISKWDVSHVTSMGWMFWYSAFNSDISLWDVSKVQSMEHMFHLSKFNSDISNWNVSKVTNMRHMFELSEFTGDISKWDVSNVTNMHSMFLKSNFNGDISDWNVSKVDDMCYMFADSKFNHDLSKWQIQNSTKTIGIFTNTGTPKEFKPTRADRQMIIEAVSGFNLKGGKPSDIEFDSDDITAKLIKETERKYKLRKIVDIMLYGTPSDEDKILFKKYYNKYDRPWYVPESTDVLKVLIEYVISYIGTDCDLNWIDVSNITDMSNLFSDPAYIHNNASKFNGDISKWDTHNVINMSGMFDYSSFNGDISKWDVSNVMYMQHMFCESQFTGDISKWDVSNVTSMYGMFQKSRFNGDISDWNTATVTSMGVMFSASQFNGDISKWDTHNVTNMEDMFSESLFNSDISKWDVSNVTTMESMFQDSHFNSDISAWNVCKVENIDYMFADAKYFDQDVSSWEDKFDALYDSDENPKEVFVGCPISDEHRFWW